MCRGGEGWCPCPMRYNLHKFDHIGGAGHCTKGSEVGPLYREAVGAGPCIERPGPGSVQGSLCHPL